MSNKNALIALAYIKENENPFIVFCNYVLYCITISSEQRIRHDQLQERIKSEFGLIMPQHVLKICLKILLRESKITKLDNGSGYCAKNHSFDIDSFMSKRSILKSKEENLINGLIDYIKEYNQVWTYEEAQDYLTHFLISQENAYNLFVNGFINLDANAKRVSPNWYIGKYITKLLSFNTTQTDYLVDIVNGLMVYIGVYETNDYFQDKNQKFRGTDFYIDTKILLRGLGFSWKLEVESTKELLQLIKDEYSGNICVFEHTIGELEAALFNASISLKQGKEIDDLELRLCAALNKYNDYDFELFSKGIRSKIEDELDYRIQPAISWHDKNVHDYNIDWNSILEYIQTNHPNWKNRAITNDVNSINSINILRKGDYSKKFGGKNKLPIFVTSNTPLISDIRKYAALFEFDKDQISWNVNSLPIISDYMLICRLWLPKSKTLVSIPTLTLARNAYAAQEGNTIFYSKLKEAAVDMGLKHNVNILDLSELRKGKIEEILVKNTLGNFEDITTEVIANSIDELIAFETINLKSSIDKLEGVNSDNTLMIDKQRQQIIVSACERYKNKLGIGVIKIKLAEIWWIINTVIFGLLLVLFNYIKDANYLTNLKTGSIIIVVITILIKILEKYFARINITNYLLRLSVSSVWKQYSNSVKSTLVGLETNFEKEIIASCLENTIIFNKYIDYCVIES